MLGKASNALVLAAVVIAIPGVAFAQSFPAGGMIAPEFVGAHSSVGYFHQVSSPEVLATPAAQQSEYYGPTAVGPHEGPAPTPDPFRNVDPSKFKCCERDAAGKMCKFDRYEKYPSHLPKDQLECVICLKEPYTVMVPVKEQAEVVVFRCFKTEQPFDYSGCEDGTCFHKKGQKELRRMRPCTVTVDLNYEKKVVRYKDVWYHVHCPCEY